MSNPSPELLSTVAADLIVMSDMSAIDLTNWQVAYNFVLGDRSPGTIAELAKQVAAMFDDGSFCGWIAGRELAYFYKQV